MTEIPVHLDVSRRERQILDVLYARGRATAAEIQTALPDAPSYSAVRALLRILEAKKYVRHEQDGPRYVYVPTIARDSAKRSGSDGVLEGGCGEPASPYWGFGGPGLAGAGKEWLRGEDLNL